MERDDKEILEQALGEGDVAAAASLLGFSVKQTPIEGAALRAWGIEPALMEGAGRLSVLAAGSGYRLLHIDGATSWGDARRVMLATYAAAPEATILWWSTGAEEWTAAMVESDREGRKRVKKLVLEREHPDEVGLLQWLALSPDRRVDEVWSADGDGWRAHFSQVLDQDGVTREFFQAFSAALDRLIYSMKAGPDDEQLRHEIALGTLLRVVFLYFLQARRALDDDRRFVMRQFRKSRDESFYRAILRPLFFGALNCPAAARGEEAKNLGRLPFLNGGLFEPTAAEVAHADLDWDDEIWRELLKGLFERHRFAVEWSDADDLCRAVDPEMLGKVFEGLMYGDRRKRSGSFYTPRQVVGQMVGQSLSAWLMEKAQLTDEAATALLNGEARALNPDERIRVREALATLTVLDPAVGTGAFLLEVLSALRRIDGGLDEAEGVIRTPGERYDRLRNLVHDHLCGVDLHPTAVRLCELRIWLAMLAALPELPASEMPPLPNLSHRLCTGNSLIDPLDWVRYRVGNEAGAACRRSPRFDDRSVQRLAVLQKAYTRAHGEEKRSLRRALDEAREKVQVELLGARIGSIRRRILPLQRLADSSDLFGEKGNLDGEQAAELERLLKEMDALNGALEDLKAGRRQEMAFSFDAHFAPVMARGGFEIVITNPPWVRTSRIDGATRSLYQARFSSNDHRLWPGAAELGVRATFGAQADMAGLFIERSLELLRPGGRLCALVPVKLFRSLNGAGLRGLLSGHRVEYLEDRSEDQQAMFDAATYPAILRVRKEKKPPTAPPPVQVSVWRTGGPRRFDAALKDLCVHGEDLREPWIMVPPDIEKLFRKMQERSLPLGGVESLPIRRGVMTGCNAAFLVSPDEANSKFSAATQKRYLRWVVQGRDICGQEVERKKLIIWPIGDDGEALRELPDELIRHFDAYRRRLEGRSDYRKNQPMWELFRCHDDIEKPKVVWRDMGVQLEAAYLGEDVIPLNTVYYLPAPTKAAAHSVMELFHSEPMRAMAFALGERARGGWRRHFAWVMRMLPVPRQWLRRWESDTSQRCCARFIDEAYGLSSDEVEVLARWRRDSVDECLKEVA